ncbi:hypothetical protein GW17_00051165 [Ensete ventricosum]|nr:hypothetical protein GW17_00051165 [Ensete ventricosum]
MTSYHHDHTTIAPHPSTPLIRLERERRAPSHATHRARAAGTARAALFPDGRVCRDRSARAIGAGAVSPAEIKVRYKVAHLQPLPPGHGTSQPQVPLHAVARARTLPRSAMVTSGGEEQLLKAKVVGGIPEWRT